MLAIIVQDKDARDLIDKLKLATLDKSIRDSVRRHVEIQDGPEMKPDVVDWIVNDVHRCFHYHVVRWLQDQGFSLQRIG